ncbi:hypothetical protein MLD38_007036 [Melastoma candidum]|uniref:Uncharacterized protein n=1 Tax=Melastoma candidum TaxID=119954 RepID=A0ACB9RTK4_9MYRT|nr:hypothetical protein MLD38_007036 [Melastoma candidum]
MTTSSISSYVNASSIQRNPHAARAVDRPWTLVAPAVKPSRKELRQVPLQTKVAETLKKASGMALDAVVDSLFKFSDQEYAPTQKNFAPVEEIGDAGAGGNPMFSALQSVVSPFGTTRETWAEGEGMLHALFFEKGDDSGWSVLYRNKFVESRTYKDELKRNKPTFLPAIHGNPAAVLASFFLNRRAPRSGELVVMGIAAEKPFFVVGILSADGKQLLHKADVNLSRGILSHDLGVTERYNILIDHPLTLSIERLYKGGRLIKHEQDGYARIGVMPRYGDAISIRKLD